MNNADIQAVSPADTGGSLRAAFYGFITFCLLSVDAYHVFNYTFNLMSADGIAGLIFNALLAGAIAMLAFIIKPATILFVNAMRLRDPLLIRLGTGVMLATLLWGVFIATSSSQNTLSEVRSNNLDTHGNRISTLTLRENDAKNMLNLARARATNMPADRAQNYLAAAEMRYSRTMVKISSARSGLLDSKPLAQTHDAGFVSISASARNAIFSLFITLAGVVSTIFSVMHLRAEHRIPAFSLESKLNHAWQSYEGNFRSASFDVNPLKGIMNGMFFGHKRDVIDPSKAVSSPRVITVESTDKQPKSKNEDLQERSDATSNSSQLKYVKCPSCATVFRTTNKTLSEHSKGLIRCGECENTIVGKDHLTDKPEHATYQVVDVNTLPSSDTLNWLDKAVVDDYHGVPIVLFGADPHFSDHGYFNVAVLTPNNEKVLYSYQTKTEIEWLNLIQEHDKLTSKCFRKACEDWKLISAQESQDAIIPEEFPANSPQIPPYNQKDTKTMNSSGISQEFARNSSGISNTQEFPRNSDKKPTLDLSHIAKSDPAEKKLTDLVITIDRLSADSDSDGMSFSPTKLQAALGMGYERIKPVFELKQQEGKISMTKPFKIVYTGNQ